MNIHIEQIGAKKASNKSKNSRGIAIFACVACALAATFLATLVAPRASYAEDGYDTPSYVTVVSTPFTPRIYGSPLSVSIKDDGKLKLEGVRIERVAGTNFFGQMQWGLSVLRVTIRTDNTTQIVKKMGQTIPISEIKVGDYITLEGEFVSGTTSFDVLAKKIKDWSIQTEEQSFTGTIVSATSTVASSSSSFIVNVPKFGYVTYALPENVTIYKGNITVGIADLAPGTRILSSVGIYDNFTKIFRTNTLRIYQDMSQFNVKTWDGTIKEIVSKNSPIRLIITVKGKDYTVELSADAKILAKNQKPILFTRYVEGDAVRFTGKIQESDTSFIKATSIRNLGL